MTAHALLLRLDGMLSFVLRLSVGFSLAVWLGAGLLLALYALQPEADTRFNAWLGSVPQWTRPIIALAVLVGWPLLVLVVWVTVFWRQRR